MLRRPILKEHQFSWADPILHFFRSTEKHITMLEARLQQARVLKTLLEAVKELVSECNFDCNDSGIALQAMDNSHVALVSMLLRADGFDPYRCDRNIPLGVNLTSLNKILKCARNDDIMTLKAEDNGDVLSMVFESKGKQSRTNVSLS